MSNFKIIDENLLEKLKSLREISSKGKVYINSPEVLEYQSGIFQKFRDEGFYYGFNRDGRFDHIEYFFTWGIV
ncbi:hypothetical protein ACE939_00925 [Aquimarina sp. W85]|uniref:hypothetical protein n=1 Tax=Aquimarina rhodophyticola TaxID=3342246 RepID=UPI003671EEB7